MLLNCVDGHVITDKGHVSKSRGKSIVEFFYRARSTSDGNGYVDNTGVQINEGLVLPVPPPPAHFLESNMNNRLLAMESQLHHISAALQESNAKVELVEMQNTTINRLAEHVSQQERLYQASIEMYRGLDVKLTSVGEPTNAEILARIDDMNSRCDNETASVEILARLDEININANKQDDTLTTLAQLEARIAELVGDQDVVAGTITLLHNRLNTIADVLALDVRNMMH